MEKIKFNLCNKILPSRYSCNNSGDQSGEYVHAKVAEELLAILTEVVAWNAKYPSSRIYDETEIRKIAKEMDTIYQKAVVAIANMEK